LDFFFNVSFLVSYIAVFPTFRFSVVYSVVKVMLRLFNLTVQVGRFIITDSLEEFVVGSRQVGCHKRISFLPLRTSVSTRTASKITKPI
jgi:hypothetical protein